MKKIINSTMTALAVMVLFFSCGKTKEPVVLKECNGKFPDESATDIHIVFSDAGTTSFELFAYILEVLKCIFTGKVNSIDGIFSCIFCQSQS